LPGIHSILKQYWGYDEFRPLQEEIIESVLDGNDALALLPTGGGKSVCFQVPALMQQGICLVVSPLIALMKDQVENLKKKGILALAIYSGMSKRQIAQSLRNAAYGPYKFLYISPERIETTLFLEYLPAMNVNLIAVDEAHCISQWGYDFRPSYLRIAALRQHLPETPVLALTASATEEVQKDIGEKLHFKKQLIFRQSFERKNLSYSAFNVDTRQHKLIDILTKVQGTGIVYCRSRKRTVEIAQLLQMHGLTAHAYHAGLTSADRAQRQQDWIENKVRIMACTNAFGMGIDKPDVRTVIHADVPDCLENYYQEAGRAGRDGKKSYAVLLYSGNDISQLSALHAIRFPSFLQIKQVYNALVNYLQIPIHAGQDSSYTFRFETFIKNFRLDGQIALYALKALEQDGWIDFNEKSFSPSTVVFTTAKELFYEFQHTYQQYEPLLSALLRTYEGIFNFPAFISELLLSRLLRKEETEIKKMLKELASFNIIEYVPQNDEPQIIFRKNRVAADDLTIDLKSYHKRKEAFERRVKKMIDYTNSTGCRSRFINNYFGDEKSKPCGICDNCLQSKNQALSTVEFEKISTLIISSLQTSTLTATELFTKLNGVPKEKARQVLSFLQAEEKIKINELGEIELV
jgi:ATP-dependent DNA helicase RecQ